MDAIAAVVIDIVRSRKLTDRSAAQQAIRAAFVDADSAVKPVRALWSTVGDEFQAVYRDAGHALAATGLVQLTLDAQIELRFGIGVGESTEVEQGQQGPILDGSAWWRAREAVEEAERRAGRAGSARTWVLGGDGEAAYQAGALLRDHIVSDLRERERRIASGLIRGLKQLDIAEAEGITQSAVSQNSRKSGAATLAQAHAVWMGVGH